MEPKNVFFGHQKKYFLATKKRIFPPRKRIFGPKTMFFLAPRVFLPPKTVFLFPKTVFFGPKKYAFWPQKINVFCGPKKMCYQKIVNSLKNRALMSFFFIFFSKNQLLLCPYLVKKRQFCQNYTILWAKKVNRMPFFSDFPRKNNNSHAHILSTKRPFYKKHTFLMPIFCQKTSILSKTPSSQVIFFNFFM